MIAIRRFLANERCQPSGFRAFTRHLLSLAAAGAVAALLACSDPTPDSQIASARAYLAKGEPQAAIIQLAAALQQDPDLPQARLTLGQAYFDVGDPGAAEIELRKAMALRVADEAVLPLLARAMMAKGDADKVVAQLGSVELKDANAAADLKTSVAAALARQGNLPDAEVTLAAALGAVPDFAPALLVRAKMLSDQRDFEGASQLIDKVLAAAPKNHEAWQFKGVLLQYYKQDLPGGLNAYRQAVALKANFLPAHVSIVNVLLLQKDLTGARAQVAALRKVLPNHSETRFLEGELALLNQDYKTAQEIGQQLLGHSPTNRRALLLAGAAEFRGGSALKAEKLLTRAVQAAPNTIVGRHLLAQVHIRNRAPAKALQALAPLLEATKPDAESLSLAAQAYTLLGNPKKAQSLFAQAAQQDPSDARSRTALAVAEFSAGRNELGFSKLQEIASADKGTGADLALVSAYYRQGRFDDALQALDALEKKEPRNVLVHALRGRVYLARNDIPAGRQSFEKALSINAAYFPAAADLANLDLADKKPDDARSRFERVIAADPANASAKIALSQLRAKAGAGDEETAGLLNDAVRANPVDFVPRLLLIDHYVRTRNMSGAVSAAQEAVAALPSSPELLDALGRVQGIAGQYQQAVSTFTKLSQMQPRSPAPHLRLAELQAQLKNTKARRKELQAALALAPNLFTTRHRLIQLELEEGRPAEAMALAKAAQRTRGLEAGGSLLVGDLEAGRGNWRSAVEQYSQGLKAGGGNALAMKLYSAYLASKQGVEAEKFTSQWMKDHPLDMEFMLYIADQSLAAGDYVLAESRYLAVVKQQPNNAVALNSLAWVTNRLKKPGALAYAEKANNLRKDYPSYMDTLAEILGENNQLPRALELQKKALAAQPENGLYRLNLAKLYVRAGEKPQAKAELEQLSKLGAKFQSHVEAEKLLRSL